MRRILLLTTLAAMMAAALALSGVAQGAPVGGSADAKCLAEAAKTVEQPGFNPADYAFHGGTELDNNFDGRATAGPDVFCGFGGFDVISNLNAGDIFLGGEGDDGVSTNNGIFFGGEGGDSVDTNSLTGTFNGGAGSDFVDDNIGAFNGEVGDDTVQTNNGTFNGGAGDDFVGNNIGTFDGGAGSDFVSEGCGPTINVEQVPPPC